MLQGIGHTEDKRRRVSDSEVILTAIIGYQPYGNHNSAIRFVKAYGYIPHMPVPCRFNRRLHPLGFLLYTRFEQVSCYFKYICSELTYIIDSFPAALCENIRIAKSRLVSQERWRGYKASMRTYFYGVKVQLV